MGYQQQNDNGVEHCNQIGAIETIAKITDFAVFL